MVCQECKSKEQWAGETAVAVQRFFLGLSGREDHFPSLSLDFLSPRGCPHQTPEFQFRPILPAKAPKMTLVVRSIDTGKQIEVEVEAP